MEPEVPDLERKATGSSDVSPLPEVQIRRGACFKCPLTIEPLVFAVFFSDALSDSVTANFILLRTCEQHFHYNKSICSDLGSSNGSKIEIEALVQPYSTTLVTVMNFLSILFPAILSLFIGPWSDYNGRKLVLIISSLGYFLKDVILGILTYFPNLGPEYCLMAVIPVALSGGMVNFITSAFSYISDITPKEKRFVRISMVEFVVSAGLNMGLLFLTYTFNSIATYNYVIIYFICAFVIFIAAVPTHFLLPESLQNVEKGKGLLSVFEWKLFVEMLGVCFKKREGSKRVVIFLSISCLTIAISAAVGNANVLYFFTRLRFGWNIKDFSFWASISLATSFLGLFIGVFLSKWMKIPEICMGFLSYVSQSAAAFYIALTPSNSPKMMYYSGLVNVFSGLCAPACRAILSESVPKDDLGKVFALTSSSEAFFPLVIGPLYTVLYNYTINTLPSAFLLLSGSLHLLCVIFFIVIYFVERQYSQREYALMENSSDSG